MRRILYRNELTALVAALAAAEKDCKTYAEAHGITAEAATETWDAVPF